MDKEYFFKTDQLAIWRPLGILNTQKIYEFINFINEISKHKDPHFSRFIDLTQISGISVNYQDLQPIADERKKYYNTYLNKKVKMVFLVNNPLAYGMARMYQMLNNEPHIGINICETAQKASELLEVDVAVIGP